MNLDEGIRVAPEELIEQFKPPQKIYVCRYSGRRSAQSSSGVAGLMCLSEWEREGVVKMFKIDQLKASASKNGEYSWAELNGHLLIAGILFYYMIQAFNRHLHLTHSLYSTNNNLLTSDQQWSNWRWRMYGHWGGKKNLIYDFLFAYWCFY